MRKPFTYDDIAQMSYLKSKSKNLWVYFPRQKVSLLVPPKCGTSSVRQFIWMNELENTVKRIQHYQVTGNIFFVVRDPITRFVSLWRSKCRNKENLLDKRVHGMSPNELMTHIESGAKDAHWTPQVELIKNLNPTLIPLESLNWWWHQSGLGSLGVFNATEGEIEISDGLKQRILTFYADDLKLYHKAQCDLCWDTVISPIVDI